MKYRTAVYIFQNSICGGCIKVAFFKDTAVSRRYRHVLLHLLRLIAACQKSPFLSTGYCGYQEEYTHHYIYLVTSYSITTCSVSRCTGGFCYSPHSKRKGGENDVIQRIQGKYRTPVSRILQSRTTQ